MASLTSALRRLLSGSGSREGNGSRSESESALSPTMAEEQRIYGKAEAMERRTGFDFFECVVLIGTDEGFDDGEIGTMVGSSAGHVQRTKSKLRAQRHEKEQQVAHELDALSSLDRHE
jgi:hypothetical protein